MNEDKYVYILYVYIIWQYDYSTRSLPTIVINIGPLYKWPYKLVTGVMTHDPYKWSYEPQL